MTKWERTYVSKSSKSLNVIFFFKTKTASCSLKKTLRIMATPLINSGYFYYYTRGMDIILLILLSEHRFYGT